MKNRNHSSSSSTAGFSLLEITLALGIIAIALITLLGTLGSAMNRAHEAAGRTLSSQISQQLMGEIQLQDWASLNETTTFRYFNEFGTELEGETATPTNSIFTAYIQVGSDPLILSSAMDAPPNSHSKKVVIMVADSPGEKGQEIIEAYRNDSSSVEPSLHLFSSVLVNLDK